jgi:hypothetical protein
LVGSSVGAGASNRRKKKNGRTHSKTLEGVSGRLDGVSGRRDDTQEVPGSQPEKDVSVSGQCNCVGHGVRKNGRTSGGCSSGRGHRRNMKIMRVMLKDEREI